MTRRDDRGSATVLALAACAAIGLVAAVLAGAGLAAVTRHRAGLATDAAALAAAAHVTDGTACSVARQALSANGARLERCAIAGTAVVVAARVSPPRWIAWAGSALGESRAGPDAEAEESGGVAPAS